MISRRLRVVGMLAALAVAAPLVAGAAPSPRHTGFCDSFMSFLCPKPTPTEPAAPVDPTAPVDPAVPDPSAPDPVDPDAVLPEDPATPPASTEPVPAPVDDAAPIFTGTPAAMRAGGLSFTGLKGISIVSVPTVDGGSVRALKISADSITITGFSLTVRPPDHDGLVTNADTMELAGDVSVYLGSVSASSMGGAPLTIGTDTPPPLDDVAPGLLDVTMGLVGSTADSIHYTNTDQRIVAAE
ncbi:hypothetical protein [Microbacterium murale]|uniref:Uncharacterized protein n=1 Tax=Microbacterium murale TaxID=1081040 RepID=A0ABQ1S0I3_9MICO|nr:hypothetical protein [Microbacterium murale]GGD85523.1 hypothetical protein GCM10007269_30540 [Microbacterium murale]